MRREFDPLVVACTGLSILCVIVVAVVSATVLDTSRRTERNSASVAQVCDLVINIHADRVRRLVTTLDYLKAPDNSTPGLNAYILRVSLPQLRAEVAKERASLPPTCTAGRQLPRIPK